MLFFPHLVAVDDGGSHDGSPVIGVDGVGVAVRHGSKAFLPNQSVLLLSQAITYRGVRGCVRGWVGGWVGGLVI